LEDSVSPVLGQGAEVIRDALLELQRYIRLTPAIRLLLIGPIGQTWRRISSECEIIAAI